MNYYLPLSSYIIKDFNVLESLPQMAAIPDILLNDVAVWCVVKRNLVPGCGVKKMRESGRKALGFPVKEVPQNIV